MKIKKVDDKPITIHQLSSKKLNYISEHYAEITRKSHIFKDEHIMDRAKENLEIIGEPCVDHTELVDGIESYLFCE